MADPRKLIPRPAQVLFHTGIVCIGDIGLIQILAEETWRLASNLRCAYSPKQRHVSIAQSSLKSNLRSSGDLRCESLSHMKERKAVHGVFFCGARSGMTATGKSCDLA